jgi:hypothetical protein
MHLFSLLPSPCNLNNPNLRPFSHNARPHIEPEASNVDTIDAHVLIVGDDETVIDDVVAESHWPGAAGADVADGGGR